MKRASAGLCLLLLLGCQRQRPAAVRPPAAPAAGVPADEDQPPMTQVTGHRWWRVEVEPDDVDGLCSALRRLASDARLRARLGAAGRSTVETSYSFAVRMQRVRLIYDELLPKPCTIP